MRKLLLSILMLLAVLAGSADAQSLGTKPITTAGADCSVSTSCAVFGAKGISSIGIYLNVGTSGTFVFEATIDGTTWFAINDDVAGAGSGTADGAFFFSNPGYAYLRVRASAINGAASAAAFRGFSGLKSTATLSGSAQGDGALQDGANGSIEATVADLTNSNPIASMIVDASGNQITSFGGGTQYTNAAAQASPIGTISLGYDGTNVRAFATNSSGHLNVIFPSAQAVSQSGTWNIGSLTTFPDNEPFNVAQIAGSAPGATNPLPVRLTDGSTFLATLPVSLASVPSHAVTNAGTFAVQAAQSGTWTVQPGNTANTTPWLFTVAQGGNSATVDSGGRLATNIFGVTQAADTFLTVRLSDGSSFLTPSTDYTHNAALTIGSSAGPLVMGRASTAVPTEVNADDDAVAAWFLRNGAQVSALSASGSLTGCTPGSIISAASVNETEIKGSAGQLYMLNVTNIGAAAVFLKLYNDTAANTDETDTPILRFVVPGSTTGAGNSVAIPATGVSFTAGITFRLTSAIADNSTGAVAASEVLVSYCYK
jgi:hypothetical protein